MCGIVGAASSWLSDTEKGIVEQLFVASSLRGIDSSGIVCISSGKKSQDARLLSGYYKHTSDPLTFINLEQVKALVYPKTYNVRVIIAHNRSATIGAVTGKNAHPFSFANVVGVHNGTVRKKWKDAPDYETDSEALYWAINQHGIEHVVKELGRSYTDAYALVFFDRKNKTLNMIRNTLRPLSIARSGGTIFWASEGKMLEWVMARTHNKDATITELEPFKLYTYQTSPFDATPEVKDLTPPLPPVTSYGSYGGRGILGGGYGDYGASDDPYEDWGMPGKVHEVPPRPASGTVALLPPPPVSGEVRVYDVEQKAWYRVNWLTPEKGKVWERDLVKQLDEVPQMAFCKECRTQDYCTDLGCEKNVRANHGSAVMSADSDDKLPDDEYLWDADNNIMTVREARPIVEAGCAHCSVTEDLEDVTTSDGEIEGVFHKDDTGTQRFICVDCYEKALFSDMPMFKPTCH